MSLAPHSARLLPSVVQPPTISFCPPGQAAPHHLINMACPNCGSPAPKALVLGVDVQLPDHPSKHLLVLRCPSCTAHFYDGQTPPDYAEPALNDRGRVPFYVQQGAGVSLITRPLARLRGRHAARYMEVGCGYGFGLDFAIHTLGWHGVGIDPAPLAALGRDALGLPIELRYLRDDDEARGSIDVVMGSEVIEHVTSPTAFIRTLKAMLKPGGVLILTTPNGDDIDQATPPGIIIPLLSPSLHLVIQNRNSLHKLLHDAQFDHIEIEVDSHSLVAFASDAPLDLEHDANVLRHSLRNHLQRRAAAADPASDLLLAFAGRAFCESINDGDMGAADRAWALLVPACSKRFGTALDSLTMLPAELAHCSLERMAELVPLNLGGLLLARAIRRLSAGTPRSALEAQFNLAAEAADAMRRALGELAMEDGQTEDIGWTARAEALLCAAVTGDPAICSRFAALPPAPTGGETRRRALALRAMMSLVNSGHYIHARAFVHDFDIDGDPFTRDHADLSEIERDALFCLAVLGTQDGSDDLSFASPARTRNWFSRVRSLTEAGHDLWWASLRGEAKSLQQLGDANALAELTASAIKEEPGAAQWAVTVLVNAGYYDQARAVTRNPSFASARISHLDSNQPLTVEQRDAVFCLGVLDVQATPDGQPAGEPAIARDRFARVRRLCPAGSDLWIASLRGELQALDMLGAIDEGAALTADVQATNPELPLPADILVRIGQA